MTIFNNVFFPTPSNVVDMMVAPYVREYNGKDIWGYRVHERGLPFQQILEPSAGKGDIIDHLVKNYNVSTEQVYCIELEEELRLILAGKGYSVIDSDFLKYNEPYAFDFIIMNPPFDRGVDHLMKAWDILSAGDIVCLLNAETLRNPHTEKRKMLRRIIDQHGRWESIGRAFADAERPTNVEVAIVWLHKKDVGYSVDFEGLGMNMDGAVAEEEFSANPLAHVNIIQSLVDQYDKAANLLREMSRLNSQYRFYTKTVVDNRSAELNKGKTLNEQLNDLKRQFWTYIFEKTKLGKQTTSRFQRKFTEFAQQTSRLAFTEENITQVLEFFFLNRDQIIYDCIVDVFDKVTTYHEKNEVKSERWKTNKSYRCNHTIIIPSGVSYDKKNSVWGISYSTSDFYNDFDKALCFLSGKQFHDDDFVSICKAISDRCSSLNFNRGEDREDSRELFESTFFRIRIFKKGTVHLIFKDQWLLDRFNQAATKGKNWIGGGY